MNNKLLAIIAISIFLYFAFIKNKAMAANISDEQFINLLTNWVKSKEGNLSNDPNDSAAQNPSPTPEKWHTKWGVTWTTYTNLAEELGYQPTVNGFINMSPDTWWLIYSQYYKRAADLTDNIILNTYISLWYWGGWNQSLVSMNDVKRILVLPISAKEKLRKLVNLRKLYFERLVSQKPNYNRYLTGWKNRAESFYSTFNKYA